VKRPYLVVYDYGQGGVWAYVWAGSAAELKRLYPELTVVRQLPGWVSEHELPSYDAEHAKGLLADITRNRS